MQVGPYVVHGEIGRGAMGVVFRAVGPGGRPVAMKVLQVDRADARARFERERRLLWSFAEADGFVPVVDSGEWNGRPYLVMPLMEGGTLRDKLDRGPLSVAEAVRIVSAVARALARAHERGVVHRDLKPENVLWDPLESTCRHASLSIL